MNQFKWCQHSILVGLCLMCHTIRADEPNREQIGKVLGKPVYRDQVTREGEGSLKSQLNDAFIVPVRLKYLHDHRNELEFSADELAFFSLYFDEKQTNEKNAGSPKLTEGKAIEKKSIKGELAEIESRLSTGTLTTEEREAALKDKDAVSQRLKKLVEHNRELLRLQADQFFFGPKLSRHLYKTYGGGRVVVTTFGVDAFDASRRWLAEREALGDFEITDAKLQDVVKQSLVDDLASWESQPRRGSSFISAAPEYIEMVLNPSSLPTPKDAPVTHCQTNAQATAGVSELVATVLGKPIRLKDITPSEAPEKQKQLSESDYKQWLRTYRARWLLSRISGEVLEDYAVRENLNPSNEEIKARIAEVASKPGGNVEADKKLALRIAWVEASAREWRTAKALYDKYGGRVAISSFGGCTSFEGRNVVLKAYAAAGNIKFHDADIELAFWEKAKDERVLDVTLPKERVGEYFVVTPWERFRVEQLIRVNELIDEQKKLESK
jgi:hypothetical protein